MHLLRHFTMVEIESTICFRGNTKIDLEYNVHSAFLYESPDNLDEPDPCEGMPEIFWQ